MVEMTSIGFATCMVLFFALGIVLWLPVMLNFYSENKRLGKHLAILRREAMCIRGLHPDPYFKGTAFEAAKMFHEEWERSMWRRPENEIEVCDAEGNTFTITWEDGDESVGIPGGYIFEGEIKGVSDE